MLKIELKDPIAIAHEVIEGKWGSGWNCTNALYGCGYDAAEIFEIVKGILDDGNHGDNERD